MRLHSWLIFGLVWVLSACAPDPGELRPSQALHAFLTALDRSMHAPDQLKVAYDWLDTKSQKALQKRAELAASLAGRSIAPWDMLVAGRTSFSSTSAPVVASLEERVDGDHAVVSVPLEGGGKTQVQLVREQGRWRVLLGVSAN